MVVVLDDTIFMVDEDADVVAIVVGSDESDVCVSLMVVKIASLELLLASVVTVVGGAGDVTVVLGTRESTRPIGFVRSIFESGQINSSG